MASADQAPPGTSNGAPRIIATQAQAELRSMPPIQAQTAQMTKLADPVAAARAGVSKKRGGLLRFPSSALARPVVGDWTRGRGATAKEPILHIPKDYVPHWGTKGAVVIPSMPLVSVSDYKPPPPSPSWFGLYS